MPFHYVVHRVGCADDRFNSATHSRCDGARLVRRSLHNHTGTRRGTRSHAAVQTSDAATSASAKTGLAYSITYPFGVVAPMLVIVRRSICFSSAC